MRGPAGGDGYQLVQLANGTHSLHSLAFGETFHPVIGPVAEAEALYVKQLQLRERLKHHTGEFVIWDVGLGAAAMRTRRKPITSSMPATTTGSRECPVWFATRPIAATDIRWFT